MSRSELQTNYSANLSVILDNVPAIDITATCHEAAELFRRMEDIVGFAVLDHNDPVGILSRNDLTIKLATQFGHAVYGKRPVSDLMISDPLIVDISQSIDYVEQLITNGYENALFTGFIITDCNRYTGMGNVLSLMRESVKRTRFQNTQLARNTELANQANRLKSQFLAAMSHELRTPLNAIIGFSELITQEAFGPISPPRYGQYADDILESGRHLLSMISDILDMSKIEAGRYDLDERPLKVNSLARNVIKMCSVLADKKDISLETEMPSQSPILIADERALKQMLLNLVSNGIKYTENEGKVVLRITDNIENGIQICVEDNGVGIAATEIEHMIEPFVQVAQRHNDKTEGTGLGLAIVKALADLHDSQFQLKSALGQGTRAVLLFPPFRRYVKESAA